ncbi:glycosyl hydrolase family 28-related protein [Paenibacillus ginsengarvi]|nr:glycosyl hydrolase family 28-related protein [Paenibacillus ginsengarvi]
MATYEANIVDYGAVGNGVADDTKAFVQAFSAGTGCVVVPKGTYKITSTITIPDSYILKGIGSLSYILKGFNGDMVRMENGSQITQLTLEGNGKTYTGRGIIIESGSGQKIADITIKNTAGYCIEYTAPSVGMISTIDKCNLGTLNKEQLPAIKYPMDSPSGGDRKVTTVDCGGGLLADFAGCSTTLVSNCNTIGFIFNPLSRKVSLLGNRIAGGTAKVNLDIYGTNHCVVANTIATPIYLRQGTHHSVVKANISDGVINQSGNNTNQLDV